MRGRGCNAERRLTTLVERDLAATLRLFVKGGLAILDAIAAQDYDTLQDRGRW